MPHLTYSKGRLEIREEKNGLWWNVVLSKICYHNLVQGLQEETSCFLEGEFVTLGLSIQVWAMLLFGWGNGIRHIISYYFSFLELTQISLSFVLAEFHVSQLLSFLQPKKKDKLRLISFFFHEKCILAQKKWVAMEKGGLCILLPVSKGRWLRTGCVEGERERSDVKKVTVSCCSQGLFSLHKFHAHFAC